MLDLGWVRLCFMLDGCWICWLICFGGLRCINLVLFWLVWLLGVLFGWVGFGVMFVGVFGGV